MLASDRGNLRGRAWCASALPLVEADAGLAVPALVAALEDESEEVRAVAVESGDVFARRLDAPHAFFQRVHICCCR